MSIEALKLALDALERVSTVDDDCDILTPSLTDAVVEAIDVLKEALAKQEQGEPVAWISVKDELPKAVRGVSYKASLTDTVLVRHADRPDYPITAHAVVGEGLGAGIAIPTEGASEHPEIAWYSASSDLNNPFGLKNQDYERFLPKIFGTKITHWMPIPNTYPQPKREQGEPDYKALWEQMCERCDCLDKELAAYTEQEQGEPVAWMKEGWGPDCGPYVEFYRDDEMGWRDRKEWTPLYAASQSKQEPVGFIRVSENKHPYATLQKCYDTNGNVFKGGEPLYTTPQQRKPLTDEQIEKLLDAVIADKKTKDQIGDFARAIEAAHGITEKGGA